MAGIYGPGTAIPVCAADVLAKIRAARTVRRQDLSAPGKRCASASVPDPRDPLGDANSGSYAGVRAGDRRVLAKAITLAESTRADHQALARDVMAELLPATGGALRMGITGSPGVGKSTLIEALGLQLVGAGHRVAVLAVDPSSSVTRRIGAGRQDAHGGARRAMPHAFIRPSPASGALGGVAAHTREAMLFVEAAGFDVVIVETVGVGQSETDVANLTDVFVLMQLPQRGRRPAGDEEGHRRAGRHHRVQQARPRSRGGGPRDGADGKAR